MTKWVVTWAVLSCAVLGLGVTLLGFGAGIDSWVAHAQAKANARAAARHEPQRRPTNLHFAEWPPYLLWSGVALVALGTVTVGRPWPSLTRMAQARRRWFDQMTAANDTFFREQARWQSECVRLRWETQEAADTAPRWFGVQPTVAHQRIDVFGGTAEGWRALLHSAGGAMLDAMAPGEAADLLARLPYWVRCSGYLDALRAERPDEGRARTGRSSRNACPAFSANRSGGSWWPNPWIGRTPLSGCEAWPGRYPFCGRPNARRNHIGSR
ncbi:hypothetical protein [Actinoallomurus sp. NPDC050550]|uniref:hypothetical protein n=1 Tax=Actinoallomurus sp. NPDC050550 TaxID=3154937 RepID=UPI0033CC92D3